MILIQAQALDNRSADVFVLNGTVIEAGDEELRRALAEAAEVQRLGVEDRYDVSRVTEHESTLSVVVSTLDVDQIGRPAPIVATFAKAELDRLGAEAIVESIRQSTEVIGRSFDGAGLGRDLESWLSRPPKGLSNLGRWAVMPFRGLSRVLRGFFVRRRPPSRHKKQAPKELS